MQRTPPATDVWFFVGHSIGVTLLGIHTIETALRSLGTQGGRGYIVVNGDKIGLYKDILAAYPNITIVRLSYRGLPQLMRFVWRSLWNRQIVFHPLAFGPMHGIHRLLSWILVVPRRESRFVEFVEHAQNGPRSRHQRIAKQLDQSIFTSLEDAIEAAGLSVERQAPRLAFVPSTTLAEKIPRPFVMVHPFAASDSRSLPMARWEALIGWLRATYPEIDIIISGGPADRERAQSLTIDAHTRFSGDIGASSLREGIALVARAKLFIGVDTGLTHIAAHVHTPTILIGNRSNPCWLPTYSPTVTILVATQNCTCDGAKGGNCFVTIEGKRYYRCMLEVPQEEIYQAVNVKIGLQP